MADLLKSAFSYLSSAAGGSSQKTTEQASHDDASFVGQVVDISNHKLRVRRAIAEGGFGIVYIAQDVQTSKDYTIKRMFAHDQEKVEMVISEINILRKLTGHVNIVEFIAAASDQDREFLILTEFCSGGALVDHLQKQRLDSFSEVLQVFYQICQALRHLHSQNPPIIHRDIKIENLLLSDKYYIKLIDFGSATTSSYYPDSSWTGSKRSFVEDEMCRNTTPMYRPPEILDLYQNFPINEALDIWALGCVLYVLCFNEHPYSDSSKLRIVNANYPTAPLNHDTTFNHLHDLIRGCFMVDPRQRPKITDILDRLAEFAEARSIPLAKPLRFFSGRLPQANPPPTGPPPPGTPLPKSPPVPRSASPITNINNSNGAGMHASSPAQHPGGGNANAGSGFLGGQLMNQIKGQAGSLLKNVKDASSKVVDVVSSSVGRTDLDISQITTRILVMSAPSDGVDTVVAGRNNIDEVRAFLDAKFYGNYAVFNLTNSVKYRHAKFDNRVSEAGWMSDRIPPLAKLFSLCHQMFTWLSQKQQHVIVVHCTDGRSQTPIAVVSLLCFVGAFDDSTNAAQLFATRRGPFPVSPSMIRYCQYITRIRSGYKPHEKPFQLGYVVLKSVPVVNRQRTGCKPYIEIHCGDQLVHTTQRDYDALRQYTHDDKTIQFPLNISVFGDVTISIYHARSTITDRMQGKLSAIKICQVQFHTGFIDEASTKAPFDFDRNEVDLIEQTSGTFRSDFGVLFELHPHNSAQFSQRAAAAAKSAPWIDYNFSAKIGPELVFSSQDEMYALTKGFKSGRGRRYEDEEVDHEKTAGLLDDESGDESPQPVPKSHNQQKPPERPPMPPRPQQAATFFDDHSTQAHVGGSKFFVGQDDAGAPELPSRPKPGSDFQADFSIFSPSIETSQYQQLPSEENSAPLVDIWPGDPSPAAQQVQSGRLSGISGNSDPNPLFDAFSDPVERKTSESSGNSGSEQQQPTSRSDNPFLVEFNDAPSTQVQPDLFGVSEPAVASAQQLPARGGDDLFGLFTNSAPVASDAKTTLGEPDLNADAAPILTPSQSSGNLQQQQQQPTSKDPFADIFGGGSSFQPSNKKQPMGQMQASSIRPQTNPMGAPMPRPPSTGVLNPNAYGARPYSPSPAAPPVAPPSQNRAAPAQNRVEVNPSPTREQQNQKSSDPFAEIFSSSGLPQMKSNMKPTTMGDMKKDQLIKDNDPETVKVRLWSEGKTNNIRALLSTLDKVLWEEGLAKWEPIPIHQLIKVSEVKRAYKKAVVVIHPDKQVGTPNERIARLVFVELNEAWSEFEKEAASGQ